MVNYYSSKPYLVRAIYAWLVDSESRVFITVDCTDLQGQQEGFIKGMIEKMGSNRISFEISSNAVKDLSLNNKSVSFRASFQGEGRDMFFPMENLIGIFPPSDPSLGFYFDETDNENLPPDSISGNLKSKITSLASIKNLARDDPES